MIKNYTSTQPHAFVGRTKELAELSARLRSAECRLLTVTGLGGSGKTRLALEVAHREASHFQHGVVFVNLQKIMRSDLLVHTIAQALNLSLYGEVEPEEQLIHYLHEKSLLLLLDNFEHLLAGSSLVSTILANAPDVKILVTSREALNLQEEWIYPLKGMGIPLSTYTITLEDYEAVQLFLHHARRVQPGFEMDNEREPVIHICTMTAGLPLALELAASWLKGLTASQIASEMRHNLDFLSTTMRNAEERHRSMRAVFDHSWKLLTENERAIFAGMSVFQGGFDSEAAKHVTGASLQILAALVEKSLVQTEMSSRFSIHEMLRQYGMERLEERGEQAIIHEQHCQYYSALMLRHETTLKQPEQMETLRSIENDFENFRLAWDWAVETGKFSLVNNMLHGLYLFGFLRSRYRETIAIFQHALEQDLPDPVLRGRLLARRWGYLQWWYETDYHDALEGIQQALKIATEENNPFEIAFSHLMVAYAKIGMQHYTEALPDLETSLALFQTLHEPYYVCWVMHRLGYVYSNLNDSLKATEYTEQSLSLARVAHNRLAMVACLYNLGSDYILQGEYAKGRTYCEESLQVATETGHQGQIAHALSMVAACDFFQGAFDTCRELAERSQAMIEDINLLAFQSYNLSLLIVLACLQENYDEGRRLHELAKRHDTNVMGYQLLYWSLAILSSGLDNRAETRLYIQKLLEIIEVDTTPAPFTWVVPAAVYVLSETDPATAVELFSFAWNSPSNELGWVRQWPLFQRLQTQLQSGMDAPHYDMHWEKGKTLAFETTYTILCSEFGAAKAKDAVVEPDQKELLTVRESEILQLLAAGLTKPQIAEALVIGTGTVKTHTLNIYRKLEVANRTQAIARAQALHLLPSANNH